MPREAFGCSVHREQEHSFFKVQNAVAIQINRLQGLQGQ